MMPRIVVLLALSVMIGCSTTPESKRDRFLTAGKKLLEQHQYVRAGLEFKNASRAMPNDPELYYQMALASLGLGDIRTAVVLLRKANDLDPKHVGTQLKLAELMSSTADHELLEEAQKRVRAVLALAPENAGALNTLAVTQFKLGHPEDAEAYFREALLKSPQYIVSYTNLADLEIGRKNLVGAEKLLKQATQAAPKSPEAWIGLGRFYIYTRRLAEAEAQFQTAVSVSPQNADALLDLGRVQNASGRPDRGEKTFRRLSDLPKEDYRSVHAIFQLQHGKTEEAVSEFAALAKKYPLNRDLRTRLVAAYLSTNKIVQAEQVLRDVLKKNPQDTDALLQRSQMYLRTGKTREAEADLSQVLRSRPEDALAHYALSRVHLAKDAYLLRRQELSEALRLNPSLLEVRIELADALITARAFKAATDVLDSAPADQKTTLSVLIMRNWAVLSAGNLAEAEKGIAGGLARSKAPELMLQSGLLKLNEHDVTGGREALKAALKSAPDDRRALEALANSYFAEKNDAAGIAVIKEYVAQRPNSASLQAYLGQILLLSGDRGGARAAFQATKKADPTDRPADVGLAILDSMEGNLDSARLLLRRLLEGNRPYSIAAVRLGMIEESAHDYRAAIDAYKRAVEMRPIDWVSLNNLATCLIATGQYDDALKYAQQAKELAPTSPFVTDTIGWALYNKGMYAAAVEQLQALKNDQMPTRRYHLAMAYFKRGDVARGRSALEAALKLDPRGSEAAMAQKIAAEAIPSGQRR